MLRDLLVSFDLDLLDLLLQSVSLLLDLIELLLQAALLGLLVLVVDFDLLAHHSVLLLKFSVLSLELIHLLIRLFLNFLNSIIIFVLNRLQLNLMGALELHLGLFFILLQAFKGEVVLLLLLFLLLLGEVSLLLQELELVFPQAAVFVVVVHSILVLLLHLDVLVPPLLDFLVDGGLVAVQRLIELLVHLAELQVLLLVVLDEVLLVLVEIGVLLEENSPFSLHLGELLVHGGLKIFEGLALLLELLLGLVLLDLNSLDSLSMVSHELLSIVLNSFFISFNSLILLPGQLIDSDLLELQLLVLQSLVSFELDSLGGQFVKGFLVLGSHSFDFGLHFTLFSRGLTSHLREKLVLVLILLKERILLVLESGDVSLLLGEVKGLLLDLVGEVLSLLIEVFELLLESVLGVALHLAETLLKLVQVSFLALQLLKHELVLLVLMVNHLIHILFLLGPFVLHDFHIVILGLELVSDLLFVVVDHMVVPLLSPLLFLLDLSLISLLFSLIERL